MKTHVDGGKRAADATGAGRTHDAGAAEFKKLAQQLAAGKLSDFSMTEIKPNFDGYGPGTGYTDWMLRGSIVEGTMDGRKLSLSVAADGETKATLSGRPVTLPKAAQESIAKQLRERVARGLEDGSVLSGNEGRTLDPSHKYRVEASLNRATGLGGVPDAPIAFSKAQVMEKWTTHDFDGGYAGQAFVLRVPGDDGARYVTLRQEAGELRLGSWSGGRIGGDERKVHKRELQLLARADPAAAIPGATGENDFRWLIEDLAKQFPPPVRIEVGSARGETLPPSASTGELWS